MGWIGASGSRDGACCAEQLLKAGYRCPTYLPGWASERAGEVCAVVAFGTDLKGSGRAREGHGLEGRIWRQSCAEQLLKAGYRCPTYLPDSVSKRAGEVGAVVACGTDLKIEWQGKGGAWVGGAHLVAETAQAAPNSC